MVEILCMLNPKIKTQHKINYLGFGKVANNTRLTIRPPFRGHVLLFDQKKLVLRGRQKMAKCPPFRHYEQ